MEGSVPVILMIKNNQIISCTKILFFITFLVVIYIYRERERSCLSTAFFYGSNFNITLLKQNGASSQSL